MIQRIQSIYLLLAGLLFGATVLFRNVLAQDTNTWILPAVIGLNIAVGLGALVSIGFYGDRKKQFKFASLLQYMAIVALLAVFGALYFTGALQEIMGNIEVMAMLGMPVVGYVMIRLASMRVKKDIELVRSMDRLR
ncbi:MAG: DUF4293 family protein [Rhodothermales bacterium]